MDQKFTFSLSYFSGILYKLMDSQNTYNLFYLLLSVGAFFEQFIYAALMADIFKQNPVFKTLK